jgi:CRISPR-associated exonuclease Cas4
MEELPFTFRVTDLKQYVYCPRILYYHTVLPQVRPITYKMEAGIRAHVQAEGREKRRSLRTYGLADGRRTFNVPVFNSELSLSGEIDMVIETNDELIVVDYKQAKRVGKHFKLQLMGYGRLLELADPKSTLAVKRGFLYLIPAREAIEVRFTRPLRRQLTDALHMMQATCLQQTVPAPTNKTARCVNCEFRRFCNDVL